ncbi:MAG: hypothetical protein IH921_04005, partial [Gemmatimonadetes bacterium]|nr:hypothetical protein [Gemmatimonadota bacterium]
GGSLVYSTCTVTPEENEAVIRGFLATRASWRVAGREAVPAGIGELLDENGMLRLLPHRHDTDGFFAVRLIRGEPGTSDKSDKSNQHDEQTNRRFGSETMGKQAREIRIAPSILAADFVNMERELRSIESADLIHVDVMDGHFVPNLTIGPDVVKALRPHTSLPFDVHLMIAPVDPLIEAFADAGADTISVHPEAPLDPSSLD